MANYDNQLDRMMQLMNYNNSLTESKKSNSGIEYHVTANNGKEYGIIKEGTHYYIKTTTPDKATIVESYVYSNGDNYKRECRYNSYNEATKQLELKLMSINESLGKHEDVCVANLNKTKDALKMLTEDTRKELDRMHQIFENSYIEKNIGNVSCDSVHGSKNPSDTKSLNDPFSELAKFTMDKDTTKTGTVEGATENKEVKDADSKLQNADKMEKGNKGDEGYTAAHDDLDRTGVADQKKSGAKAVVMNESTFDETEFNDDEYLQDDTMAQADMMDDQDLDSDIFGTEEGEDVTNDVEGDITSQEETLPQEGGEDMVGFGSDEEADLDSLLEEFLTDEPSDETLAEENEVLDGPHGSGNDVSGEETMERVDEECEDCVGGASEKESCITGPCATLDHHTAKPGKNGVHGEKTMDKMDEAINRITDMVYESLCGKKKCAKCGKEKCECGKKAKKQETLQEAIQRIVNEEVTKLDAWGKHPRYRKAPMTTPANKEVLAGTAKGDWNDDSAKGEQPYGKQIGSSAPFDKTVDMLTDQVLANLKESLKLGK